MASFWRLAFSAWGGAAGYGIAVLIFKAYEIATQENLYTKLNLTAIISIHIILTLLFAVLAYLITPLITKGIKRYVTSLILKFKTLPVSTMVSGCVGILGGLLTAFFLTQIVALIPIMWVQVTLSLLLYVFFVYFGVSLALSKQEELASLTMPRRMREQAQNTSKYKAPPKILDTSVIIDGRIYDIAQSGFVEGDIVIPGFVLGELRHIADSSDSTRRSRGRRGLDILTKLREETGVNIVMEDRDYNDVDEVDLKLLCLADDIDGIVVTNDYNLNKVAAVQGRRVLNINELALATKPVLIPGEELAAQVVKEGKEPGQGVAYLEDGTMIVVENGVYSIGELVQLIVTSVIQTAAGRLIFARLKNQEIN